MKRTLAILFTISASLLVTAQQQDLRFKKVLNTITGQVSDMKQDKQGIIWMSTFDRGLKRFDGVNLVSYINNPANPNSLSSNFSICLTITRDNRIWIGLAGTGLDIFDPVTGTFTNFRHDPKNPSSIASDTVCAVLEDRSGNIWIGTSRGLDQFDPTTGKFQHYVHDKNDPSTISHNEVYRILQTRNGELWIGCWPYDYDEAPGKGGLNRFDVKTKKFTRYVHTAEDPKSIHDNRIVHLFEDRNNNFWIATYSGLTKLDQGSRTFTRHYVEPVHGKPISTTPALQSNVPFITFISEDSYGALWFGLGNSGMNRYDPMTKLSSHFGYVSSGEQVVSAKDTITGFTSRNPFGALSTRDGLFWIASTDGALFNLNYKKIIVPFFPIRQEQANSFYFEEKNNILWIGTRDGLVRKDMTANTERVYVNDPGNSNSLSFNRISSIDADRKGNLWLGTRSGLDKFDPRTGNFQHYKYDPGNPASIASNNFNYLVVDHADNLWAASDSGLLRIDALSGEVKNYKPNSRDTTGYFGYSFIGLAEDKQHFIWISSEFGAFRLNTETGKFRRYLPNIFVKTICVDAKGIVWVGGDDGLFYLDPATDTFILFADANSPVNITGIISIIEDGAGNLWISTSSTLVKINKDRSRIKKYAAGNGIRFSNFYYNHNYRAKDGRLFIGENNGYYSFYPHLLSDSSIPPNLFISAFRLGNSEVKVETGGIIKKPLWETEEIRLRHNQNVFSFDFFALDYSDPGNERYLFMLENYDDTWRDIGTDRRAFFFNVAPGNYVFRVKVINEDGSSAEKSLRIHISPPWWKTWWAYSAYVLLFLVTGLLIYRYQKRYIIKKEREKTREKELAQAREIEKAYTELKATQAQLIQSEKMASLGELTAGIAHEIQNPLNFVNNFSEVNAELIDELKEELAAGNTVSATQIANDIRDNEEKIKHHGKRADAIVKGMLQHSRTSSGTKEPVDINALCDEYVRLAYHGMRAKDKSFNAKINTEFDSQVGSVMVLHQDLGRVILNLLTNAFYAVSARASAKVSSAEASAKADNNYVPTVTIKTKKTGNTVEILVADNGTGIPENVKEKIFQPFFTTKPTGQGTGLGLSLSYDIITKGHGGELKMETKEGEGTIFTIILPNK